MPRTIWLSYLGTHPIGDSSWCGNNGFSVWIFSKKINLWRHPSGMKNNRTFVSFMDYFQSLKNYLYRSFFFISKQ
jgi:hypothetical protein